MLDTSWKGLSNCRMHSLKGDLVSLRLAYDNKDKALNQSTIQHRQWEKTENGQNCRLPPEVRWVE